MDSLLRSALFVLLAFSNQSAFSQESQLAPDTNRPDTNEALTLPPKAMEDIYASMWRNASTAVRDWVTEQAASADATTTDARTLDASLRSSIKTRFTGQGLDDASSSMLVFLVLRQTVEETAAEHQRQKEFLRTIDEALAIVRPLAATLQMATKQSMTVDASLPCRSELCTRFAGNAASISLLRNQLGLPPAALDGEIRTVGQLRERTTQLAAVVAEVNDRATMQNTTIERITAQHAELLALMESNANASAKIRASTMRDLK